MAGRESASPQPVITTRSSGQARVIPPMSAGRRRRPGGAGRRGRRRDLALDLLQRGPHVGSTPDDVDLPGNAEEVGEALQHAAIRIDDHHPRAEGRFGRGLACMGSTLVALNTA